MLTSETSYTASRMLRAMPCLLLGVSVTCRPLWATPVLAFSVEPSKTVQPRCLLRSNAFLSGCASDDKDQSSIVESDSPASRRAMLGTVLSFSVLGSVSIRRPDPAVAYEKTFPDDLDFEDGDVSRDLTALREARIAAKKRKTSDSMNYLGSTTMFRGPKDVLSSAIWGGALWFMAGSRSNPLVTPVANLLYDEKEEPWLQDRNEGLFASPPAALFIVLGALFVCLGIATDRLILLLAEGDADVTLQLACVSLIGGGALELGRIASGEKGQTRQDFDRDSQLESEFAEFADQRLMEGGNCHRSEVVASFRRYYAKYRQSDSIDYPLSDLEIERLLRSWARKVGKAQMSSAGFFTGIQINDQADVFVQR